MRVITLKEIQPIWQRHCNVTDRPTDRWRTL